MTDKAPSHPPRLPPGDPASLPTATSIDRRHLHRTVPVRVLCFGLSRTGTNSLRAALLRLGYFDVYHMSAIINENPRDAEMWNDAINAKFSPQNHPAAVREYQRPDFWDALLGHCEALTDTPVIIFWRELLAKYPDAKVILTVRDTPEAWHTSLCNTIMPFFDRYVTHESTWQYLWRLFAPRDLASVLELDRLLLRHSMYKDINPDGSSIRLYDEHNNAVIAAVPPEKLLVFNVKQGWAPLCEFLGHDMPQEPFPRTNDAGIFASNTLTNEAEARIDFAIRANFVAVVARVAKVVAAAAVGALAVAVYRRRMVG